MMPTNPQEEHWKGEEGARYLERNFTEGSRYKERRSFYNLFEELPSRDYSILEVGCSCGLNLSILKDRGFNNLTGIDIGAAAVAEARMRHPEATILEGSILSLPFADGEFDVVFSSGVLIHQNPAAELFQVMDEMYRCSSRYILGLEDFSDEMLSINYRNKNGFYWRGPYGAFWSDPGTYSWSGPPVRGTIEVPGAPWHREYYKFEKNFLVEE